MIRGARLILVPWQTTADGRALLRTIAQHDVTVMQATPATWRLLLEAGWQGSAGLKILCGGEPLPKDLARQLLPRCAALWNMYGPTETTIWSTCCRVIDVEDIRIGCLALPRFYRHLSKEEHDAIGGDHASTSATSVYGGIY